VKVTGAGRSGLSLGKLLENVKRAFLFEPDAPRVESAAAPRRFVPSLAGGMVGRMNVATAGVALLLLAGCATTGGPLTQSLHPERVVERVVDRQIHREHAGTFEVGGDDFGAGIKLGLEPLADDHPLVAETPSRAARTDGTTWARTFWIFEPSAAASTSIPVGSATITAGLSANAKIEAEMIAPYRLGSLRVPDLPVSLDTPMVPGQEAILGARGALSANAGGRFGSEIASVLGGRVTVGVSAGGSIRVGREAWINLRILELPGDLRLVAVTKGRERQRGGQLDASVGYNADLRDLPGRLGDIASSVATDQLNEWLGANFNAQIDFAKGEQVVGTFLFDRRSTDPAVHRAYTSLLKLRAETAETIAEESGRLDARGRPIGGIAFADFATAYAARSGSVNARIGKIELIKRINNTRAEHGTLRSSFGEPIEYWTGSQARSGAGLITSITRGERTLERQLTIMRGADGVRTSYYRFSWETKRDRVTTAQDILSIAVLAHRLGALEGHEELLRNRKFLSSFDDTNRAVEVYFADLERLVSRLYQQGDPERQVIAAFGRAWQDADLESLKNPGRGRVPWIDGTIDPDLARLLELGPQNGDDDRRSDTYRWATGGRYLHDDAPVYQQMLLVLELLRDLRDLPSPEEKIERFRSARLGTDFWIPLIALADVAGADGTLVNRLEVKGLGRDERVFTFASEGRVTDPRAMVDEILRGLERGDDGGAAVRN
jgi:hypothetical protein